MSFCTTCVAAIQKERMQDVNEGNLKEIIHANLRIIVIIAPFLVRDRLGKSTRTLRSSKSEAPVVLKDWDHLRGPIIGRTISKNAVWDLYILNVFMFLVLLQSNNSKEQSFLWPSPSVTIESIPFSLTWYILLLLWNSQINLPRPWMVLQDNHYVPMSTTKEEAPLLLWMETSNKYCNHYLNWAKRDGNVAIHGLQARELAARINV